MQETVLSAEPRDTRVEDACATCGQPATTRRIDWSYLADQVQHGVLNMDRGLLYSIKSLMLRPGHMIRDYIEGRRGAYVKPLPLLLILAAAVVLVSRYLGSGEVVGQEFIAEVERGAKMSAGGASNSATIVVEAYSRLQAWINTHFAAFTLLLLPLEALALRLSFHGVGKLNYPEWLVITTFITVQAFVLCCFATVLQRWWPWAVSIAMPLAIFAYGILSLVQFFQGYPRWKSALRTVGGFALFLCAQNLLLIVAAVVIALSMRT